MKSDKAHAARFSLNERLADCVGWQHGLLSFYVGEFRSNEHILQLLVSS